jgi:hypothetical protein
MTKMIPIERLCTGTYISVPGYDAVEVYECEFDGEGYAVRYPTSPRAGWDDLDFIYVPVGSCVEYAGRGEPSLRDPDLAELEALDEARAAVESLNRATIDFCAMLTSRYADSVREGSEHQMGVAAE